VGFRTGGKTGEKIPRARFDSDCDAFYRIFVWCVCVYRLRVMADGGEGRMREREREKERKERERERADPTQRRK
jgi:hypothetical protein